MPWLHYYENERKAFPDAFATMLTDEEAMYVFNRARLHYKIHCCSELKLFGYRQSGKWDGWNVRVSHAPSVGLLAHELAHAKGRRGKGQRSHTKKHHAATRRICTYIMTRLPQWREERAQRSNRQIVRLQERVVKLEAKQAYQRSPQYKLQKLQERRDRWRSKKLRAENAIKKLDRRIHRLEGKVQGVTRR